MIELTGLKISIEEKEVFEYLGKYAMGCSIHLRERGKLEKKLADAEATLESIQRSLKEAIAEINQIATIKGGKEMAEALKKLKLKIEINSNYKAETLTYTWTMVKK